MFRTFCYQTFKSFSKKKSNVVLVIIALAMCTAMIFCSEFIARDSDKTRNPATIAASFTLFAIVVFSYMVINGLSSGNLGFSTADVNFYLAGPFTPRFNIIHMVVTAAAIGAYFMFVICCQMGILSEFLVTGAKDAIFLVLSLFFLIVIASVVSQFISAKCSNDKKIRDRAIWITIAIDLVFIGAAFFTASANYASVSEFLHSGAENIVVSVFGSVWVKLIPGAGWYSFIFDGAYGNNAFVLILGIALTLAFVVFLFILLYNSNLDYYEAAIESAQRIEEIMAAKKAGINDESASVSRKKINVGNEAFKKGSGASVFFHKHLFENKRTSKLFFVNPLTIMFKVMSVIYLFLSTGNETFDSRAYIFMAVLMFSLFDSAVFAGGRIVSEYMKPYIFLIPEKSSAKIFYAILAFVPEIVFNSVLAAVAAAVGLYLKSGTVEIPLVLVIFLYTFIFDFLCILTSLYSVRIFKNLGKTGLMIFRYLMIYVYLGISVVPAIICAVVCGLSLAGGMLVFTGCITLITLILFAFSGKLLDNMEAYR